MEQEKTLESGFILKGNHDYTILKTLNRGGFGITYLAEAEFMDHHISQVGTYAIKEFFPEDLCHRNDDQSVEPIGAKKSSFKESYDEFKAEADCLHGLHHEGIVPVNEVIETNGTVYYVMKFLRGKTLEEYVTEKGGQIDEDEAIGIIDKVAEAIGYLHEQSILHLDVKPDNIMMTGEQPVLIDFGSFRKYKPNGKLDTKKTARCVTDGFSPKEQYDGIDTFTPQADVYSLGATLFYMLTGNTPVEAEEMSKKWVYLNVPRGVSEQTTEVLANAMAKSADDRIESVSKMVTALHGKPVGTERKKVKTRLLKEDDEEKKGKMKMLAIAVAAVAACLLLFFFLLKPSSDKPSTDGNEIVAGADSVQADSTATAQPETAPTTPTATAGTPQTQGTTVQAADPSSTAAVQTSPAVSPQTPPQQPAATPVQAPEPVPAKPAVASSGTLDLGYAVWNGGIADGKPDGKGTMAFKSSHLIDSRDIDHNTASSGDQITGVYSKGHLVYGTWTKTNGETKKIMIGQ